MIAKLVQWLALPLVQWFITEGVKYIMKQLEEIEKKQIKEDVEEKTTDALTNDDPLKGNKSTEEAWGNFT